MKTFTFYPSNADTKSHFSAHLSCLRDCKRLLRLVQTIISGSDIHKNVRRPIKENNL